MQYFYLNFAIVNNAINWLQDKWIYVQENFDVMWLAPFIGAIMLFLVIEDFVKNEDIE